MKTLVKGILDKLGYRIQGTRYCPRQLLEPGYLRAIEFDDIVCRRMFDVGDELSFIQVGAFDGTTRDPLHKYIAKYRWRGGLIEPQSKAVRQLREIYCGNDSVVILQAALNNVVGKRKLFTVESETAPSWAGGLASFDRECILKHSDLIPGLEGMIKEETVDCITFDHILERLPLKRFDLLQIDTEGADAYVLSLFPLDRVQPAIIHWEIKHLTKQQREDCFDRLIAHGYRLALSGDEDMMAVNF